MYYHGQVRFFGGHVVEKVGTVCVKIYVSFGVSCVLNWPLGGTDVCLCLIIVKIFPVYECVVNLLQTLEEG